MARNQNARLINAALDSMFVAMAKLGGVSLYAMVRAGFMAEEFKGAAHGIYRVANDGAGSRSVEAMVEALIELGYLTSDDHNAFFDLVAESLAGNDHFTPEGIVARAIESAAADYAEYAAAAADEAADFLADFLADEGMVAASGDDLFSDIEALVAVAAPAAVVAAPAAVVAAPAVVADRVVAVADLQIVMLDDVLSELGYTAAPDFALATYTADEERARIVAAELFAKAAAAEERAADRRAAADAMRHEFRLTGSDRACDIAAAHGQTGFDFAPDPHTFMAFKPPARGGATLQLF